MASSISFLSSSEILGCFAGVSKMKKNQHSDQMTPIPPVSIKKVSTRNFSKIIVSTDL